MINTLTVSDDNARH